MRDYGPSSWTDQLWRSGLTLLFTVAVLFVAWELASRLLGPLIVLVMLVGIIRLALGRRSHGLW